MEVAFEIIYKEVIGLLEKKLPKHLTYHSVDHTKYVLRLAEYIAHKEGMNEKDVYLIKIASLYHDIGFIIGPKEHEKTGCELAREELKKYNFSKSDIEKICGMIMATKIPQQPNNEQEMILADADLEYLSTRHFETISENLFSELKHFNENLSRKQWNDIQINFIANHKYHTAYCSRYKEFRKRRNLQKLLDT